MSSQCHPPLILHHYALSPYAEKIRSMLGYADVEWLSLLSPARPPRPNLDPLTGGYRRIPVLQIGGDIFCDSKIITEEIAEISQNLALSPESLSAELIDIMHRSERDVFFAVVNCQSPARIIATLAKHQGALETLRFLKDRVGVAKTAKISFPSRKASNQILGDFFSDIDKRLVGRSYLNGETPCLADFAVYHPLWMYVSAGGLSLPKNLRGLNDWMVLMESIGHGKFLPIDQQTAFFEATNEPRELPNSEAHSLIGKPVCIAPNDYARDHSRGVLVAQTTTRSIIKRETEKFGKLHIHFPREGYAVEAAH